MAVPSATAPRETPAQTALDRFLTAVPYAVVGIALLGVLLWEASLRKGPTTFTDELEWAQISRAIAHTGHAARRGAPVSFKSLYAFLIAPAWWLPTTASAYTAIKYLNEVVMATAAIPIFFLTRWLTTPRAAALAALGTLCTSAYFYGPQLLPEALAFPTFALSAALSVRALAGGGRRWTVAAVVVALVSVEVRSELAMGFAALVLAAAWLWVVGPRGRRLRAGWSVVDHAGVAVLAVGVFVVCNRAIGNHSTQWRTATQTFQGRIWHLGLESASALALGLGLLPVAAALASLWIPDRRGDPRWRAFAAFLAASIVTFGAYTAVKAAYLSATFGTFVEERNLIYLQPLLLVGAAVYFTARRRSLPAAIAGLAVTAFLVLRYGYQLNYPYGESPGYGIAAMANRDFRWDQSDIRLALVVVAIVVAVVVLAPFSRVRTPLVRALALAAALCAGGWMLTAQITSSRGASVSAKHLVAGYPPARNGLPMNWVDELDGGQPATYLGQGEPQTPNGVWLLEFWNTSLKNIWTLDGTAPGPGGTTTPDLVRADGTLTSDPGLPYVLEDNGVQLIGKVVKTVPGSQLALVRLAGHPWRLKQTVYNVSDDGWITPPPHATDTTVSSGTYAYFGSGRGTLSIQLNRMSTNGSGAPAAHVTLRIGPISLNQQRAPVVRHAARVEHLVVRNGQERSVSVSLRGPVAVEVVESPTFRPSDYGGTDGRLLGIGVGFQFTPQR